VDSDLVSVREDLAPGDEQILMLNNGCLCCTVRDDLVQMLTKLVSRPPEISPRPHARLLRPWERRAFSLEACCPAASPARTQLAAPDS
jgi:hypothetical protein